MPLAKLIPTIRRVTSTSDASLHPLSSISATILISMKDITAKYRTDIPQMIKSGSTGNDAEEAMILFAWTHEKRPETDNIKGGDGDKQDEKEARWTKRWLQRFERRE